MGLDNLLWNFGNELSSRGIPNYIHWDFSRSIEITGPNSIYPEGIYTPIFYMSENPVRIALIPRYK